MDFKRPELVSLSSQSEYDEIIMKFANDLVLNDKDGNSLVFDDGVTSEDSVDLAIPVQTQVNPDSQSTQNLGDASDTAQTTSAIVMIIQFGLTYTLNTGLSAFWGLINSQQNVAYMPIMNVQHPGPVTFYLETLVEIATFDPIPVDIVYEATGLFDFQWTAAEPSREPFTRIGVDRVMVNTLGSMIIALVQVAFSQATVMLLGCFTFNHFVRKIYRLVKIDGSLKPIMILFMLEGYIDLLIGALLNTENDYLFLVADNWGPNGNLNYSDQFTVLLGNFFYFSCIMFPVVVFWVLRHRTNQYGFMLNADRANFNSNYDCLYDGFKHQKSGLLNYYSVYMIRRVTFVAVCFIFWEEQYTLVQVVANIGISFLFVTYLVEYRPFSDPQINNLEIINEYAYVLLSIHQLCFTDFAAGAEVKNIAGWSFVFFAILNLLFPNLFLVLYSMYPDIRDLLSCKRDTAEPIQRGNMTDEEYRAYMDERRHALVRKYNFKLRSEFLEEEVDDTSIRPKKNQIEPMPAKVMTLYENRTDQMDNRRRVKHMVKRPDAKKMQDLEMSEITEGSYEIDISEEERKKDSSREGYYF